uniref:Uncharacterized protein n=1 Tax=Bionectria ochroleuca TaxID=29856 RepID=A0A8H7TTU8_BIOOC
MVAYNNLSFAAVLSLGLAAHGLASKTEATNLIARGMEFDGAPEFVARDTEAELEERDDEGELQARDLLEELYERDMYEEDKYLFARARGPGVQRKSLRLSLTLSKTRGEGPEKNAWSTYSRLREEERSA